MREIYETREEYEMAMRSGIGNNYILPMESNEEVKVLQEKLDIAVKECQQLKELLKECKPYISYSVNKKKYLGFTPPEANILTKIDNAIGEK